MPSKTIKSLLQEASAFVPTHEARLLLAHALGADFTYLVSHSADAIDPTHFHALLARRVRHEPLQLIIGSTGFWDFTVEVSRATLIPRADSETLVEAALAACGQAAGRVLDLGTGTGCLLLAFLRARPGWTGAGVDLSPDAAALAARNALRAGVADRALFAAGNWASALQGGFDLVLSNPPYVRHAELGGLAAEVRDWEPIRALDGGDDGLNAYRSIIADLPRLLKPEGVAVLELGIGQAADVRRIAEAAGFGRMRIKRDLGGIERAIIASRTPMDRHHRDPASKFSAN